MILSDLPRICLLRSCSRDDMVLPVSITVLHQVFLLYLLIDSVAYLWGTTGEWLWYSVWTSDRQMWRTFRNVLLEIKWRHHSSSDINLQPCLGQLQSILGLKLPRISLRSGNPTLASNSLHHSLSAFFFITWWNNSILLVFLTVLSW